ncbi:TetR/AcrR family transcriptional regulator [Nocardia lijiangensis]|uniref:TetR/AcrR family transcriptional regulator n=1 Tax=Nocardia lijiangensis TaxID=299618 RepID=UPI003D7284CC
MTQGPRARLIEGAIELVREQGVHGAGLAALLERSNTSRNSLYQHFPSGKSELVAIATEVAGRRMSAVIEKVTGSGEPEDWVGALIGWWKKALESSAYATGCPIASAALAESEPGVQAAAGSAFAGWTELLTAALIGRGVDAARARSLASFVISALEGAIVQARATKSTRPLDDVRDNLAIMLRAR